MTQISKSTSYSNKFSFYEVSILRHHLIRTPEAINPLKPKPNTIPIRLWAINFLQGKTKGKINKMKMSNKITSNPDNQNQGLSSHKLLFILLKNIPVGLQCVR